MKEKEKQRIINEMNEKTKDMNPKGKVCFALVNLIKQLLFVFFSLLRFLLIIIEELVRFVMVVAKTIVPFIFLGIVVVAFLKYLFTEGLGFDINKFNIITIVTATLCLLVIEFLKLVKDEEKLKEEKLNYLRQSAEMLFGATIYFCSMYILNLVRNLNKDFSITILNHVFNFYKQTQDDLIIILVIIMAFVASFFLIYSLFILLTKVGTIYELPEEEGELGLFQRIRKRMDPNRKVKRSR